MYQEKKILENVSRNENKLSIRICSIPEFSNSMIVFTGRSFIHLHQIIKFMVNHILTRQHLNGIKINMQLVTDLLTSKGRLYVGSE